MSVKWPLDCSLTVWQYFLAKLTRVSNCLTDSLYCTCNLLISESFFVIICLHSCKSIFSLFTVALNTAVSLGLFSLFSSLSFWLIIWASALVRSSFCNKNQIYLYLCNFSVIFFFKIQIISIIGCCYCETAC
jgi:hypothetical protein